MNTLENEVTDRTAIPQELFHLVPQELFVKYLTPEGAYDCRNKKEWGMSSDFIHTTTTRKDLKEKIADQNWKKLSRGNRFSPFKDRYRQN